MIHHACNDNCDEESSLCFHPNWGIPSTISRFVCLLTLALGYSTTRCICDGYIGPATLRSTRGKLVHCTRSDLFPAFTSDGTAFKNRPVHCRKTVHGPTSPLFVNHHHENDGENSEKKVSSFDNETMDCLYSRIRQLRIEMLEEEMRRPPNPNLSPSEFVTKILEALLHPDEPLPDSGFRLLLRASTPQWRKSILKSVAAPYHAHEELVASALATPMQKSTNQFGILVGSDEEQEEFTISFPSDTVEDSEDDTCWLECRLQSVRDNKLLVVMGWHLRRREMDGAWLIDKLDWHDFRDAFRPGIGQEEWARI